MVRRTQPEMGCAELVKSANDSCASRQRTYVFPELNEKELGLLGHGNGAEYLVNIGRR